MAGLEIHVRGAGDEWEARVVRRQRGNLWLHLPESEAPAIKAKTARDAVAKAERRYLRLRRQSLTCERCGSTWRPYKIRPKKCPACGRPWKYKRRPASEGARQ